MINDFRGGININDSIICENSFGSVETYYESYMYYNYPDYFNDKTFNDFLRNILQSVKEKEIVTEDVLFNVVPKIYISKLKEATCFLSG